MKNDPGLCRILKDRSSLDLKDKVWFLFVSLRLYMRIVSVAQLATQGSQASVGQEKGPVIEEEISKQKKP